MPSLWLLLVLWLAFEAAWWEFDWRVRHDVNCLHAVRGRDLDALMLAQIEVLARSLLLDFQCYLIAVAAWNLRNAFTYGLSIMRSARKVRSCLK